ncbi:hypothetical protein, partial [Stenotrophomonas maltophilia]|uniref:hypothetical protein n=1 Tax=Stenotrophomonas maltophilia TaxID=40324 RepID=UPI001953F0C5
MAFDESPDHLGEMLFVPPETAEEVKLQLPDIALPGEPRDRRVELPFIYRLKRPADPDGSTTMVLP